MKIWIAHDRGAAALGDQPAGIAVEVCRNPARPPSDPGDVAFWVPPFGPVPAADALLERMPALRVVQLPTAGADFWVGRLPESVTLCDASGAHTSGTAEWVVTAVLSCMRGFAGYALAQAGGLWQPRRSDELAGKRVLIVGAGDIALAVAARLVPFDVSITLVARTARDGVHAVDELPALLPEHDIVVLLVPLTAETSGMVDSRFLALMPDGALLVNAARGPVVDTEALVEALRDGRIGAALDVTDPEPLPEGHPLFAMPNVLLTPHIAGSVPGMLPRLYELVRAQVRRFLAGQPLHNVVRDGY